jgi:diguanylate cyclase (GGDEF)-like protein
MSAERCGGTGGARVYPHRGGVTKSPALADHETVTEQRGSDFSTELGKPPQRQRSTAERLQTLLGLSQALTSALELDDMLAEFVGRANELTYADSTVLSIYESERDAVRTLVQVTDAAPARVHPSGETYSLDQYPVTRQVLKDARPVQIRTSSPDDDPAERDLIEASGYRSLLMLPLIGRGEVVGLMELYDVDDRVFEPEVVEFCQAVCAIVGVAVRNATLYAEMQELATHDPMTGLGNRALFEEHLSAAVARSARSGEPLALLLVDLDGLKRINDGWGHAAGDAALRALARALTSTVRAGDLACRVGGDEFAVILAGARRADALRVADRTRRRLSELGSYRISGGVAERVPGNGAAPDATGLYSAADRAAYRAKRAGGGQVL